MALDDLETLLDQLKERVESAGGVVHEAADAAEANRIVVGIVRGLGAESVVKVKSMTTAEIELNRALEAAGVAAYETDLAELIVQLGEDLPSHILVPAIHRNRSEIRGIFLREMGRSGRAAPADLSDDPVALAGARRAFTCASASSPPTWRSPAPTSWSPRRARSSSSSRRATGGCV